MKLSQRIQTLQSMVSNEYDHIWDCCCDHGYLGLTLLQQTQSAKVHFVDIVPQLTEKVRQTLEANHTAQRHRWHVECVDVAQLPLQRFSGRHLVIIAGVGGDLTLALVEQICQRHPQAELEFLLCPVHHLYMLRQALRRLKFGLIDEKLIEENRRFYEVLHLSRQQDTHRELSVVGDSMWSCAPLDIAKRYQATTIAHYQRLQRGHGEAMSAIVQAYQRVQLNEIVR